MHDRGGPAAGSGRGLEKMESKNKFNPYTLLFLTRSACLTVETTQLRFRLIPELENTVINQFDGPIITLRDGHFGKTFGMVQNPRVFVNTRRAEASPDISRYGLKKLFLEESVGS
jgi:hypothetical protein